MSERTTRWLGLAAVVAIALTIALAFPSGAAATPEEKKMMAADDMLKANHYKCYPILDWTVWDPKSVTLEDQFGKSQAKVMVPAMLCNPVDKNGEGSPNPKLHQVCYRMRDDPSGPSDPVKEVTVSNQFGGTRLWVGMGQMLCLPSTKQYDPD